MSEIREEYGETKESKLFESSQFEHKSEPGSGEKMDKHFVRMLGIAQELSGRKFKIVKGYVPGWVEKSQGYSGRSLHTMGKAVVIECIFATIRYEILYGVFQTTINEIVIYPNFIYLGQQMAFNYKSVAFLSEDPKFRIND